MLHLKCVIVQRLVKVILLSIFIVNSSHAGIIAHGSKTDPGGNWIKADGGYIPKDGNNYAKNSYKFDAGMMASIDLSQGGGYYEPGVRYILMGQVCSASGPGQPCKVNDVGRKLVTFPMKFSGATPLRWTSYKDLNVSLPAQSTITVPGGSSICFVLFNGDPTDTYLFRPAGVADNSLWCSDATPLSPNPPMCWFDLPSVTVDLGVIDKYKLHSGLGKNPKTSLPINIRCTHPLEGRKVDGNISFDYKPFAIGDENIISTTTAGFGVALYYKDKVVSNGVKYKSNFDSGMNQFELQFEPVKDPMFYPANIQSGKFSAYATMIFSLY